MTALGKLFRTTTFKLTLVYLTVFALFAAFLLGYFALNTRRLITEQITDTVNAEITGLSEQYRHGRHPAAGASWSMRARAGRAPASISSPPSTARRSPATSPRWRRAFSTIRAGPRPSTAGSTKPRRPSHPEHHALVRVFQLPGGFRLLVGRDLEERERLYHIVLAAGRWSVAIVIVLGLAGGLFVTRRVLRRVDAMTETTRTIMAGDLGGRLPVAGTGDELDRLARKPQRHARAHRGADARPEGGVRQYRARSQDAAHAAAQPRRAGAARRQEREPNTARRWKRPSRNPTG